MKKLISRDKVVALLGEVASGRSLEAAPIAQAAKIPMIAPAADQPEGHRDRRLHLPRLLHRSVPRHGDGEVRPERSEGEEGRHHLQRLQRLQRGPREVLPAKPSRRTAAPSPSSKSIREGDKDFRAQLTAIKAAGVDAVFVPGYYTESALIVRQARDSASRFRSSAATAGRTEQLLEIGGDALNGCLLLDAFLAGEQRSGRRRSSSRNTRRAGTTKCRTPSPPWATTRSTCWSTRSSAPARPKARSCATRSPRRRISRAPAAITTIDKERNATKGATIIAIKNGKLEFNKTVAP